MSNLIHNTAIVDKRAEIAADVEIGPYAIVGPNVKIGAGTKVHAHVSIKGWTKIGESCELFEFSSIGSPAQDLSYRGEECHIEVGNNTIIREYATINLGTQGGKKLTKVGSNCFLMTGSHVGHDCCVGDGVVLANAVLLGGHVVVGNRAIIGGGTAIHQFVRIGRNAMVGGVKGIVLDVLPFCLVGGEPVGVAGLNSVGLKRSGIPSETAALIKKAYRLLFRSELLVADAIKEIRLLGDVPELNEFVEFIKNSKRGILRPAHRGM